MASRAEITTRYAKAVGAADKRTEGRILDKEVSVTGWSRINAPSSSDQRRAPPAGVRSGRRDATRPWRLRANKFSDDALWVWGASPRAMRSNLAASMSVQLDGLERHGELVDGQGRNSAGRQAEFLAMSPVTNDRCRRAAKVTDWIRGVSTTNP